MRGDPRWWEGNEALESKDAVEKKALVFLALLTALLERRATPREANIRVGFE
jgi:hypothetical protein